VQEAMMDYNLVRNRRLARKSHRCGTCDRPTIKPGHVYLECIAFPGHDALSLDETQPQRLRECLDCAIRYGRDHQLEPIPEGQPS
jgi:hypothetical protein